MSEAKHFDYEEVKAWERKLRSMGLQFKITNRFQGVDIVHVSVEFSILPGQPLPMIEAPKP